MKKLITLLSLLICTTALVFGQTQKSIGSAVSQDSASTIIDFVQLVAKQTPGFYDRYGRFFSGINRNSEEYYTNGNGKDLSQGLPVSAGDVIRYSVYGYEGCSNIIAVDAENKAVDAIWSRRNSMPADPSTAFVGEYTVPEGVHHIIISLNLSAEAKSWQVMKLYHSK